MTRSRRPRIPAGVLEDPHPASRRGAGRVRAVDARRTAAPWLPVESRHALSAAGANGTSRVVACDRTEEIARRARLPHHASRRRGPEAAARVARRAAARSRIGFLPQEQAKIRVAETTIRPRMTVARQETRAADRLSRHVQRLTSKRQSLDTAGSALTGRHQPAAREHSHLFGLSRVRVHLLSAWFQRGTGDS